MTTPPVLSVSQVEDYDPEQLGGCPRRWWFERVQGHRSESTAAHEDGHQGHALLAHYLTTGERPGRVRLGKAVNAVIDSGALPTPGPDLRVEERFSLQEHRDSHGQWVPLDLSRTLWQAGHPWEGFVDLRFRRGDTVTVWDHKFSSDIHARALTADRLLRTVQMPVYALDTLRHWPDATAVNLVHLYVSRRGIESFIRHQRVSVEQVRERAELIRAVVHQMDAVRGVTAQDDVPFNRAACHARTGCPHQFRCNAFRRKTMNFTDEEKAMFGLLKDEPAKLPTPARVTEPLPDAPAGRVRPPADLNLDDIFESPVASTPKPQPAPTCEACGEVLTPENSSRLKTGDVKHIGCAKGGINLAGGGAIVVDVLPTTVAAPKCPDCPHPAHVGKRCEGKRGKGQCRCGEAVSHTPAFEAKPGRVLADGTKVEPTFEIPQDVIDEQKRWEDGKRLEAAAEAKREELDRAVVDDFNAQIAELDGTAPSARPGGELDAARRRIAEMEREESMFRAHISELEEQLRTAREIIDDPELGPRGSWSGTLAVNVTVELGPSTLALIQSILKR